MIAVLVAVIIFLVVLGGGMSLLRLIGREPPPPPPPGEMRKVDRRYRCSMCGTEMRVTMAPDQAPEAPRHCMEEMDLVSAKD